MDLETAINDYKAPEHARRLISEHPPLAIAGPTGSGKGTVAHYLTQSENYSPVVSDTTRTPRKHNDGYEVNGVQYWFITEAEAAQKLADGAFIESKWVHGITLYGTSIASYERVVKAGRTPLLEIDVQGIEDLMDEFPGFESILLIPPSFDVWQARLDGRGDMDLEQKLRRFATALDELKRPFENPRFHPVVNVEVVDTAKVIVDETYRDEAYRKAALETAEQIALDIEAFLAAH